MATEQGYYALAAYDRMINGKTALYDMSDVTLRKEPQALKEKALQIRIRTAKQI